MVGRWATQELQLLGSAPADTAFVISEVRVNGWWSESGSGTFYLEIWDANGNELYHTSYSYDQYFNSYTSWGNRYSCSGCDGLR